MLLAHDPLEIPEIIEYIDNLFPTMSWNKLMTVQHTDLDKAWRHWLTNDTCNTISGLDSFQYSAFSPGSTDAFGEFIARNSKCRLRVSRSDFILTKILSRTYNRELKYLEDGPLESNDCVILSFPFSGNGSKYPGQDILLDSADKLNVPVFIDGAYFGISSGIHYPLDRKCVTDFTVSLSKNMVGDPLRLGIRFTKNLVDDCITAGLIGADIFDRAGAYLTICLLEKYSHNWTMNRYRSLADKVCQDLNLTPTNTVTIALGDESMMEFKRGDYVRICITNELTELSRK